METNTPPKRATARRVTHGRSGDLRVQRSSIIVACLVAAPSLAAAQELPGRFELTPYAAFRFGGEFEERDGDRDFALDERAAHGLIFSFRTAAQDGQWEALYAQQPTKIDLAAGGGNPKLELEVDYLHFGGAYRFAGASTRPFVSATVGAAHFSPRLPGFASETFLSGSLGGGVLLRADKRVGVRLDARLFATFLGHDSDIFCHASDVTQACAIAVASSPLLQWEAAAGIVFRF